MAVLQPPEDIQTDNTDQPAAVNDTGPVQPGDSIIQVVAKKAPKLKGAKAYQAKVAARKKAKSSTDKKPTTVMSKARSY